MINDTGTLFHEDTMAKLQLNHARRIHKEMKSDRRKAVAEFTSIVTFSIVALTTAFFDGLAYFLLPLLLVAVASIWWVVHRNRNAPSLNRMRKASVDLLQAGEDAEKARKKYMDALLTRHDKDEANG